MKSAVLFGGTGFIGTHLAQHLLKHDLAEIIFLVNVKPAPDFPLQSTTQSALQSGRVVYVEHDVRKAIPADILPSQSDLVFNLAAVHREPGHVAGNTSKQTCWVQKMF